MMKGRESRLSPEEIKATLDELDRLSEEPYPIPDEIREWVREHSERIRGDVSEAEFLRLMKEMTGRRAGDPLVELAFLERAAEEGDTYAVRAAAALRDRLRTKKE